MNLQEIRVSGLLEQYVIGALGSAEASVVAQTIDDFPQLKTDIDQISDVLRAYNRLDLSTIPSDLREQIIQAINHSEVVSTSQGSSNSHEATAPTSIINTNKGVPWTMILGGVSALLALACVLLFFFSNRQKAGLEHLITQLEESLQHKNQEISMLELARDSLAELSNSDNIWYALKPSQKYLDAEMYLIKNPATKATYAKINKLPYLASGRSYKVWTQSANGSYTEVSEDIESMRDDFINDIQIPVDAVRLVIAVHRDGISIPPTARTIIGTIEL